ncbi:MAG: hypothetical protein HYZ59_01040, partial [Actinobacteria bacterium]|nr:hypothetical protein [Actinomycetota bacterium]
LRARRELIGDYDLTMCFRYAGLSHREAEDSMRLFAAEVMPVLRADSEHSAVAAGA